MSPLPDYLWGIETSNAQEYNATRQLPDYLWGIETPTAGRRRSGRRCCFQTTYEELKLLAALERDTVPRALPDYLWGIETLECVVCAIYGSMLPDYLWGIETRCTRGDDWLGGFQTTYEELKHILEGSVRSGKTLPDYLWGIETITPFSLPSQGKLPDYLWGIETDHRGYCGRNACRASRLPMRNWNPTGRWYQPGCTRFQTTYEELKLLLLVPAMPKAIGLPDYLWGIETRWVRDGLLGRSKLPDYLWGIETGSL
mgnify:CR=1 FL=1